VLTKPTTHRGKSYRALVSSCEDSSDYDITIQVGDDGAWKTTVVGMWGAGGLELSEYSPTGGRVTLDVDLIEQLHEDVEEAVEKLRDAANDEED
jgi:hypothetical protein